MENYIIYPSDCRPIRFKGEVTANHTTWDQNATRWSETTTYLTEGGTHILVVAYRTQWQGEQDRITYLTFTEPGDLVATLESEYPFAAADIANALNVTRTIL